MTEPAERVVVVALRAVLRKMMRELNENDWPSDATWNEARRLCGMRPLRKIKAGRMVGLIKQLGKSPQRFKQ